MSDINWVARGARDYLDGVPRVASPDGGAGTRAGEEWRAGFDVAAASDDAAKASIGGALAVCLRWDRNKKLWRLVTEDGRQVGSQHELHISQEADAAPVVTVVFTGVLPG